MTEGTEEGITLSEDTTQVRLDYYEALRRLNVSNLLIRTIPGEEWTLSVARHNTLLVPVYSLTGIIAGTNKPQAYRCDRLAEILLQLMRYGRNAQYQSHTPKVAEQNVIPFMRSKRLGAETLEEHTLRLLRGGDIIFNLIPGESWCLTRTCFGLGSRDAEPSLFHLAEEKALGTTNVRLFKGLHLEEVLLDFLLQQAVCVERNVEPRIMVLTPRTSPENQQEKGDEDSLSPKYP